MKNVTRYIKPGFVTVERAGSKILVGASNFRGKTLYKIEIALDDWAALFVANKLRREVVEIATRKALDANDLLTAAKAPLS